MPDTPPERTYKHQVPADVFIEAFTAPTWTATQTKKFNALGIFQLTGEKLKNINIEIGVVFDKNILYVLLFNAEIIGDIKLVNNSNIFQRHWVFKDCKLGDIGLYDCKWVAYDEDVEVKINYATNFYFVKSIVSNFTIDDCKLGSLSFFDKSELKSLSVRKNSKIRVLTSIDCEFESLNFHSSTTEDIQIFECRFLSILFSNKSYTGAITISNCLKAKSLNVLHQSVLHELKITSSEIEHISIDQGNIGWLLLTDKSSLRYINNNSIITEFNIQQHVSISKLEIKNSIGIKFTAFGSAIKDLNLSGNCVFVTVYINECESESLRFSDVYSEFIFSKITSSKCLLENCMISELRFENDCAMELYVSEGMINHLNFDKTTLT